MSASLDLEALGDDLVSVLRRAFGDKLCGIVLFGSLARGEADKRSDIDLFVLLRDTPWNKNRKKSVYFALDEIRRDYKRDTTVIERDLSEVQDIDRMLIDVAMDGMIFYDPEGTVNDLLERVRAAVNRTGLVRYRTEEGKYGWKLKRKLRPGGRFSVTLEEA